MQLDIDIEPTFRFTYMKCIDKQKGFVLRGSNRRARTDAQTDGQMDGCYQVHYLPALWSIKMDDPLYKPI